MEFEKIKLYAVWEDNSIKLHLSKEMAPITREMAHITRVDAGNSVLNLLALYSSIVFSIFDAHTS